MERRQSKIYNLRSLNRGEESNWLTNWNYQPVTAEETEATRKMLEKVVTKPNLKQDDAEVISKFVTELRKALRKEVTCNAAKNTAIMAWQKWKSGSNDNSSDDKTAVNVIPTTYR